MVEWKKLGEVLSVLRGMRLIKNQLDVDAKYPVFHGGIEPLGNYTEYNREANSVMIINVGASAGTIGFSDRRFWSSDGCFCLSHSEDINQKYLYHYLSTRSRFLRSQVRVAGIPTLDRMVIEKLDFPYIPLSEQSRIVGILDTFTASIANLKEQIGERRKQYEHYRDQLLDLEGKEGVEMKCFGEFCEILKGNGVQKSDFVEKGVGCIHYGQIYTHYGSFTYTTNKFVSEEVFARAKKAAMGDVILTDTSENVDDICKSVAYLGNEEIAVSNHTFILKHKQNPKFLSYSTSTNSFSIQKRKYVAGAKVSCIKTEHFAKIQIYLPSLSEQSRIVSILDQFEASIANLEAQLQEREKQYEHYRNQLLTFE